MQRSKKAVWGEDSWEEPCSFLKGGDRAERPGKPKNFAEQRTGEEKAAQK